MKLVDEVESLLLYQFKNSLRLKGLLRSLIEPLQAMADGIQQFSQGIRIDEVSDQWLDVLGGIVGQKRAEMRDEDYRTWIKIRIKLNRCNGTAEELLDILEILLGPDHTLILKEYLPKDIVLVFFGSFSIPVEKVFSLITKASLPGFNHLFINAAYPAPFRLDTSAFMDCQFADFFKEDIHYERI